MVSTCARNNFWILQKWQIKKPTNIWSLFSPSAAVFFYPFFFDNSVRDCGLQQNKLAERIQVHKRLSFQKYAWEEEARRGEPRDEKREGKRKRSKGKGMDILCRPLATRKHTRVPPKNVFFVTCPDCKYCHIGFGIYLKTPKARFPPKRTCFLHVSGSV